MTGVATVPPPGSIMDEISRQVAAAVAALPPNARGAMVGVATTTGVNIAVVSKVGAHTEVVGWIGKSWGQPVEAGAQVRVSW